VLNKIRIAQTDVAIRILENEIVVKTEEIRDALGHLSEENLEDFEILQKLARKTAEEVKQLQDEEKKLRLQLSKGVVSEKEVQAALKRLLNRVQAIDRTIETLHHSPYELMEKVVKPTVAILVRDTKGDHYRGSGVLFSREKYKDVKTKRTLYRYRGFTAYHVWDEVLKHQKDEADENFKGKKINPSLLIQYYGGNSKSRNPKRYITDAKVIYPNEYLESYRNRQDILVYEFTSGYKLSVAELATDIEIDRMMHYGSPIYAVGIAIGAAPGLYSGIVANPNLGGDIGTVYHAYAYFGQSGGPIFDAKTLKVISVNQRVHIGAVRDGFGVYADTNILYGHSLKSMRWLMRFIAPKKHKKALE
jgi:hypothetical protein